MPFPKQSDVEIPLLRAIADLGGAAKPKDVYPAVAACFPDLSAQEQEITLESSPSTRKWWNLVQWVRQHLVDSGEIDGSTRGIWKITDAGRERLKVAEMSETASNRQRTTARVDVSLRDLANRNRDEIKKRVLSELKGLSPDGFEHFSMTLLEALGYRAVSVTRRSGDGGIDGFGDFRQGAVSIKSAFQAKRWSDSPVGRPEIDKFRGAIQGDYDHGVFITTSRFTRDAEQASYKKGAITILLLDGQAIAEMMVDRGIGVVRQPVYLYEVDPDFFDFERPTE